MARDTAGAPGAIINSKRPSGASPNPARPDLGQGSPQMPEADTEHATAGDTGHAPGETITTPRRRGLKFAPNRVWLLQIRWRPRCPFDRSGLANKRSPPHAPAMFVITEADEAAIRAVCQQRGEFAAAIELRRRFPGITDNAQARECVRTIAAWKPLPRVKRIPKVPRLRRKI
jgi:hypothetical protein